MYPIQRHTDCSEGQVEGLYRIQNFTSTVVFHWGAKLQRLHLDWLLELTYRALPFFLLLVQAAWSFETQVTAAEFLQLISDANVPEEVATSLEGFDVALFARSCESPEELESFIQHAIASAGVTQLPQRMLAKASIRVLFSRCRAAESLPHLGVPTSAGSLTPAAVAASQAQQPASASWQEAWPAKLKQQS